MIDYELMVKDRVALLNPLTSKAKKFSTSLFGNKYTIFCGCYVIGKAYAETFFKGISAKGYSIIKMNSFNQNDEVYNA